MVKKAIPISENLAYRGIASFPCAKCGGIEDDTHVFLTCPFAASVWELAPFISHSLTQSPTMGSFITAAPTLFTLPPSGILTPLWPWILWNLWKARNKLCFEQKHYSAIEVITKSITDAKEWQLAQGSMSAPHTRQKTIATPLNPPTTATNSLVCNIDAAWSSATGNCGFGAVFSGPAGSSLPTVSDSRPFVSSALMGEALAMRAAIMIAFTSNVRSLTIRSDSLALINLVKAKESRPELFGILFDVYHFSNLFDVISFVFTPRLCNTAADAVAKTALVALNNSPTQGV